MRNISLVAHVEVSIKLSGVTLKIPKEPPVSVNQLHFNNLDDSSSTNLLLALLSEVHSQSSKFIT